MKFFVSTCCLLVIMSLATSLHAQEKSLSKKEAKAIAAEINKAVDKAAESIEQIDWDALGKALNRSIDALDKHSDAIEDVMANIDLERLGKAMEKVAKQVEQSVPAGKLEKQLERIAEHVEKTLGDTTKEPEK